jgi:dienelactone hydrolase
VRPITALVLVALLLTACGGRTASPPAEAYRPASPGAFAVGMVDDLVLRDEARDRELTLRVWYPEPAGRYPVILFSPELGRSHRAYEHLGEAWAARGYISIHVSHPGSDIRIFAGKAFWRFKAIAKEVATSPTIWSERAADLVALIDRLDAVEAAAPALAGRLDATRIGVAGHSLGALSTLLVAGLPIDLPGRPAAALGDPRPLAFLAFSPPGPGAPLPAEPWELARPVMLITGGRDDQPAEVGTARPASWRSQAFATMTPGGKAHLAIADAHHFTFSNGGGASPPVEPAHLAIIQQASCAFWDRHLKGVPALETGLAALVRDGVTVEQR